MAPAEGESAGEPERLRHLGALAPWEVAGKGQGLPERPGNAGEAALRA